MCQLHLLTIEIVAYLYVSHFFFVSLYITVSDLRVVYAYHYQRRQQKQLLLLRTFFFLLFFVGFVLCVCVSVSVFEHSIEWLEVSVAIPFVSM